MGAQCGMQGWWWGVYGHGRYDQVLHQRQIRTLVGKRGVHKYATHCHAHPKIWHCAALLSMKRVWGCMPQERHIGNPDRVVEAEDAAPC